MTLTMLLFYVRPLTVWGWLVLRAAINRRGARGWV